MTISVGQFLVTQRVSSAFRTDSKYHSEINLSSGEKNGKWQSKKVTEEVSVTGGRSKKDVIYASVRNAIRGSTSSWL